ncbi:A-kinase anchor protein 4 [Varanus komodoensis]|nr:A-kinase anchor protein 4 [Varanus komodoensis]
MTTVPETEHPEPSSTVPVTRMNSDIDWLHSRASLCKVSLFSSDKPKSDKERKLVCFVDVSSLGTRDSSQSHKPPMSMPSDADSLDVFDLEEKEIVVIKDDNKNSANTEGAVCFFKQGHLEKGDVGSWLSNDLQKYAVGFQHALTPLNNPQKSTPFDAMADTPLPNSTATFNCPGA